MQLFAWLSQRDASATFDLFEDLRQVESDLPVSRLASQLAEPHEPALRSDDRKLFSFAPQPAEPHEPALRAHDPKLFSFAPRPAERHEPALRHHDLRLFSWTLALLGMVVVAASAAAWAQAMLVQAPSVTVTLPPARDFGAPVGPAAAQNIVPTVHKQRAAATTERAAPLITEAAAVTSDAAAALPETTDSKSRYTSLEPAACTTLPDKAVLAVRRCRGIAGYAVETGEAGTAGYFAIVRPGGERLQLDLSRIRGGGSVGKLAEWRAQGEGRAPTLIVRVGVASKSTGSLLVAKLDPTPCIVAVIPGGPRQNEKARSVADRKRLDCPRS